MIPCRVDAIHDDGVPRRWEIKYLAAPYSHWTVEEHLEEEAALAAFLELWHGNPPVLNLSMRSHLVSEAVER